jgi:hypothetical protein
MTKARRGTECPKAKKWCGLRGRQSLSTATVFCRSQNGWLEVTNALGSLFQHGISMQQSDAKGWRKNGFQPAKPNRNLNYRVKICKSY